MKLIFCLSFALQFCILLTIGTSCDQNYKITTTWDSKTHPDKEEISLKFSSHKDGLKISIVDAPFYGDPEAPTEPPGRLDGLWDYEVVEAFFLGKNDEYLEVEFSPSEHYLIYYLKGLDLEGNRTELNTTWVLDGYTAKMNNGRWMGEVVIPTMYFPLNVIKFNAYAIHKSGDDRTYMSLFPAPNGEYEAPNFHRLKFFQSIDLSGMIGNKAPQIFIANFFFVFAIFVTFMK